jgi:Telomere resolvase
MNYSRDIIVDRYRQRISSGKRTKLQKDELLDLINVFVENLATLTTLTKIKALCTAEIALLEEGYPQATIGKVYLPMYRSAIKDASENGALPMTKSTSRQYTYQKRNTSESGTAIDHLALDFLKYDSDTYAQFTPTQHSTPASPTHTPIDPIEHLEQQISRIWSHINSTTQQPHTNIDELTTARNRISVLESLLSESNQRIKSLESDLSIALRSNLSYQKQIEKLSSIAQPLPRHSKKRPPTRSKITAAINNIMFWNSQNNQKFAISQTLLLKATGCNLPAIKRVLLELSESIEHHHTQFGIQPRHQSKNIEPILDFIQSQPI